MSAYFATVFRLTWSTRSISDLERPAASIDRISFTVSRGTVISSILPGRARQSNRPGETYGRISTDAKSRTRMFDKQWNI